MGLREMPVELGLFSNEKISSHTAAWMCTLDIKTRGIQNSGFHPKVPLREFPGLRQVFIQLTVFYLVKLRILEYMIEDNNTD